MQHLDDDLIERYSLERLDETELAGVEEHLLICSQCQDRVESEDQYVRAARAALSREESSMRASPGAWSFISSRGTIVACAGALALLVVFLLPVASRPPVFETVRLSAVRGTATEGTARANTPLRLRLDATSLAPAALTVEIADGAGKSIWKQPGTLKGNELFVEMADPLPAGNYWVRLYSGNDQVREFSLTLR
jgi:hypothetical protein